VGGGTNTDTFLAEINVTPFVDVMLVLLIIFMVTAPMLTQGVDVDLPQTKAVETLPDDTEHLVLSIKPDETIWLDEYQVEMVDLQDHLARLVTSQNKQLYLRADKTVPYGIVVQVMGEVRAAGIQNLGIVALPAETAKAAKDKKDGQ
jgi:biopolymer transport protein TolR